MSSKAKVVNIERESCDVFIGRPSKWGNPFKIGSEYSREQALKKYSEWIPQQKDLLKSLHEIKGKTLGCYCKPKACHGDILFELANS